MLPASVLGPLCRGIVLAAMFLLRFVVAKDKILLYKMGQSIQNQSDNSFFNVQLQHNFLREGEKERLCNGTFGTNCCSNLRLMVKLEPFYMCRFYSPAYKSRQTNRCYPSLSSVFAPLTKIEWDDVLGQFCLKKVASYHLRKGVFKSLS